jgi:hypothetical protein
MGYSSMIAQVSRYGDVIVAFCVVQSLAFGYKLGQTNDDVCKAILSGGRTIFWIILGAGVVYSALVLGCSCEELQLRGAAGQAQQVISAARHVGWGRIAIVVLSTVIAALGLRLNLPKKGTAL